MSSSGRPQVTALRCHSTSSQPLEQFLHTQSVTERVWAQGVLIDLVGLLPGGYELTRPLAITVSPDPYEGYLAADAESLTYGTGASISAAVEDFKRSLVEELQLLEPDEDVLAQGLALKLKELRGCIRRRQS